MAEKEHYYKLSMCGGRRKEETSFYVKTKGKIDLGVYLTYINESPPRREKGGLILEEITATEYKSIINSKDIKE